MTYERLGKTNIMVSRIGLGGYNNAEKGVNAHLNAKADPPAYRKNLQYLVDNGVNLFDTAPDYGTEEDYGLVLGTQENRNKVFIITKVSRLVKDLETGEPFSRQEMEQECRNTLSESLRRLRTDYVDMLLLHHLNTKGDNPYHNLGYVGPDFDYFRMAYAVINGLIHEGLVNFKGFTSHYPDTTRDAVILPGYENETDVAIVKYTITRHFFQSQEPEVWESEAFPVLTQQNVGVIQMKALLSPHSPMNEKMQKSETMPEHLQE
jgi:aryl-alcohol dehydrogenase-like predicted oxidoreductase